MNFVNIFCILAKTGGGKNEYINRILADKKFLEKTNLKLLTYGTTRSMRPGEKEGVDYYFHSREEFESIDQKDLIETRSYYTVNDGEIFYFTKNEYLETGSNIICTASPYQYESYKAWCSRENIKGDTNYKLSVIFIDTDIKIRIERIMKRSSKESDIYEMCRRIIEESREYNNVTTKISELADPMMHKNVCYINNDSDNEGDIRENCEKIKRFIQHIVS